MEFLLRSINNIICMILFTYYILYNLPLWISLNFFNIVLEFISIKLTVLSPDPIARYYPSGENATLHTVSNKYKNKEWMNECK